MEKLFWKLPELVGEDVLLSNASKGKIESWTGVRWGIVKLLNGDIRKHDSQPKDQQGSGTKTLSEGYRPMTLA